ncbi:MAG: Fic family protein [Candidatus Methanomethylophilaceae archaeon]|nr:Fic family protein [Candidatus Methanomethylophilaceae archaeon]
MIDYNKYSDYRSDYFPVRHRRKDLFSMNIRVSSEYRGKIRDIRSYDARLGGYILSLKDYVELVAEAHAVNVHWSTKIEGNKLSLDEVRKSSREIMSSSTRIAHNPGPYQEIVNHLYSYFMDDMLALPWDLSTVASIHGILMKDTGEECTPGSIREEEEMQVTDGKGTTTFIACPASHVRDELQELLDWMDESPYDPMITAILFFYQFESIHPFTEGNGRTGRTLFHILMQEMGFRRFNLCKLEDKLLGNSAVYYSLLEYTGEKQDYTPLAEFFIDCIEEAYREAVREFSEKDLLKDMDDDSRNISMKARGTGDWFSVGDAKAWINGLSEQSVRSRLASMVEKGVLEKEGHTRSTRFRFIDPFRTLNGIVRGG